MSNLWEILFCKGLKTSEVPVISDGAETVHEYLVFIGTIPFVELTGEKVKNSPPQISNVVPEIEGFGFTFTSKLNGLPIHPSVKDVIK